PVSPERVEQACQGVPGGSDLPQNVAMEQETARNVLNALEFYLRPAVFHHEATLCKIRDALAAGRLVVIRDAVNPALAEKMHQCLDKFSGWTVYERHEDHFAYRHHSIRDKKLFPPEFTWCEGIFSSQATKAFMRRLSQRD